MLLKTFALLFLYMVKLNKKRVIIVVDSALVAFLQAESNFDQETIKVTELIPHIVI